MHTPLAPPSPHIQHTRGELRGQLRHRRRALGKAEQTNAALRVLRRCARHPWIRSAQYIAGYLPADGELDPTPLMRWFATREKHSFLPCVDPRARTLTFRKWRYGARLKPNRFGIGEPLGAMGVGANRLDVILLPLVGYDRQGNRLGMGGGFYDRTLAEMRPNRRTKLIGLAHSFQEVERLPVAPWDVPLDLIINDAEVVYPYGR